MLTEKKNIDQLFQDKLGSYEKAPPLYLWKNIQGTLDHKKRIRRFTLLRTAGIAAAIVLAFLAGWMMTKTSHLPDKVQFVEEKGLAPVAQPRISDEKTTTLASTQTEDSSLSTTSVNALNTLGTFAPSTKVLKKEEQTSHLQKEEIVLFETEEEFLDAFKPKSELFDQLGSWMKSLNSEEVEKESETSVVIKTQKESEAVNQFALRKDAESPAKTAESQSKKGRWSLKAEVSPLITGEERSSRTLAGYNSPDAKSGNTVSAGMIASYKINDRLSVKSGLIYSGMKQTTRNTPFLFSDAAGSFSSRPNHEMQDMLASNVYMDKLSPMNIEKLNAVAPPQSFASTDIRQNMRYMEIPLTATYKVIDRKIDLGLSGGMSANILVGNNASVSENGIRIATGETANLRDMVYSGTAGIELSYELSDRITVTVEPRVKRYLNSISKSEAVNYKPYQVGVFTGISYKFN